MIISAGGLVVDHYGDVLLIQRDDTRTLAPPGGASDIGELPPDTAVREVREETGLIVMAVRLVGLYYLPTWPNHFLSLVFRCIMRGGEIETSVESPHVGFFKTDPLPTPMLAMHQRRISQGVTHAGGAPVWETNELSLSLRLGNRVMHGLIYPWLHFRRRRAGQPPYSPPPEWTARSLLILRGAQGDVLWMRDPGTNTWVLPGGASATEPPWETAGRALKQVGAHGSRLTGLSGVYPAAQAPEMTFAFIASGTAAAASRTSSETAYFMPGEEPEESRPEHRAVLSDAMESEGEIVYRHFNTARS